MIKNLVPHQLGEAYLHKSILGSARLLPRQCQQLLNGMGGSLQSVLELDQRRCPVPVSYTHLDVYKRQLLVYSAGREYVTDVWVAGQLRVANGHLLETNEIELINLAALWQNQIRPLNV